MPAAVDPRRVADIMTSWIGLEVVSCKEEQQLWAGYGDICSVTAKASSHRDSSPPHCDFVDTSDGRLYLLILKLISPPESDGDEGHIRKLLSYEVEQCFYTEVAPNLGHEASVATCLASTRDMEGKPNANELLGLTATLMTDLRPKFPVAGEKRSELSSVQVEAALEWLANFHAQSWKFLPTTLDRYILPPLQEMKRRQLDAANGGDRLWLNGGYTYLETRREQFASLSRRKNSEWAVAFCQPVEGLSASVGEMAAAFLIPRGRSFETYIHGDVKSENLFSTKAGDQVAFFDFQYAGLGLGVCDLAKLFTCSVPLSMLTDKGLVKEQPMGKGEEALLRRYRKTLLEKCPRENFEYPWDIFTRHWETALVDWCRFQASWGFWGNTAWLQARVRWIIEDDGWKRWLQNENETGMETESA